jgi:hypothetical protein
MLVFPPKTEHVSRVCGIVVISLTLWMLRYRCGYT